MQPWAEETQNVAGGAGEMCSALAKPQGECVHEDAHGDSKQCNGNQGAPRVGNTDELIFKRYVSCVFNGFFFKL